MVLRGGVAGIQVSVLEEGVDGKVGLGASKKITLLFRLELKDEVAPVNQRPGGCLWIVTLVQSDSQAAKAVWRIDGMLAQNSKCP